jgi:hypothetical protein
MYPPASQPQSKPKQKPKPKSIKPQALKTGVFDNFVKSGNLKLSYANANDSDESLMFINNLGESNEHTRSYR